MEGGQGYVQTPPALVYDQSGFRGSAFLDNSGNPYNINEGPGGSGGGAFTLDNRLWGITSGGAGGTTDDGFTIISVLNDPEVLSWRDNNLSKGGRWAFLAAHEAQNFADPLVAEFLVDSDNVLSAPTFRVTEISIFNNSQASGSNTDYTTQDLAMVRYEAVPEPTSLFILAVTSLGLLRRRRV